MSFQCHQIYLDEVHDLLCDKTEPCVSVMPDAKRGGVTFNVTTGKYSRNLQF